MLTIFNDSTYTHFTVDYSVVGYREYDTGNPAITPLQGNALYTKSGDCGDGSLETVTWDYNTNCIGFNCHGATGNGNHEFGDSSCQARGDDRPYQICYGSWVFGCMTIDSFDPGNGDTGGGANGNGTNNGDSSSNDNHLNEDETTIGISPNDGKNPLDKKDKDCKFLNDLLIDSDFNTRLFRLIDSANRNNFEEINEYTQDLNGNSLPFHQDRGTTNVPTAPVRDLANNILRTILVHTHYKGNVNQGTVSMYSYSDLQIFLKDIAKISAYNKPTSRSASVLITSSNSGINVYAIKKNPNSIIANNYLGHQIAVLGMTAEEIKNEKSRYEKNIRNNADDQNVLEKVALKQLKKMGLQLYKTTDGHSGWEQLTLNPNPSDPNKPQLGAAIPCN